MEPTDRPVELFVRSLTPSGAAQRQEAVLDRLERLTERGIVEEYTVTIWGEQFVPGSLAAETSVGRAVADTVERFEAWADAAGVSVDRFYPREAVDSGVTGDRYTAVSLPVMAMAEYVDGELAHVTPHADGEAVETVAGRLEDLAEQATIDRERAARSVA